jgi:hypothetical protein
MKIFTFSTFRNYTRKYSKYMLPNNVRKEGTVLFFLSYTVRQHFKLKVDSELCWMPFHIVVTCNTLILFLKETVL